MKKIIGLLAILMLATFAASAQTTAAPQTTATPKTQSAGKQTKQAKPAKTAKTVPTDDAGIQQCIQERLSKTKMAGEGFQAAVSGGTATFTGSTKVAGHKGGVSGLAKTCGAKSVVNNITIEGKPAKATTPKPAKKDATKTS